MNSRPSTLSLSELMEKATAISGLDKWGDLSFTEPADLLLTSCADTADLNALGRKVLRSTVVRHLVNRLLVDDHIKHRAEALPTLGAAVVVTGLPRTGTTLLHNLLALDPRCRVLHFWEALHPVPPDPHQGPTEADLIDQAARWLERLYEMVPAFRTIHAATPTGPEECDALLQNEFASQHFDDMFNAESYSAWFAQDHLELPYVGYARQLQVLAGGRDAGRWVLKSPSHLGHLDAVLRVSQDWQIVHCHRQPSEAVPSYASLILALRSTYSDTASPVTVGRQALHRCRTAMDRALATRRACPERVLDVSYRSLLDDPMTTVRALYQQLGWFLDDNLARTMALWLAAHPQGRHGVHRYDLGQFGITSEDIAAAFEEYLEEFGAYC